MKSCAGHREWLAGQRTVRGGECSNHLLSKFLPIPPHPQAARRAAPLRLWYLQSLLPPPLGECWSERRSRPSPLFGSVGSPLKWKMPFITYPSGSPGCEPVVLQLYFQVSRSYWTLRQHPELPSLNRDCQLQFGACHTDEIREPHLNAAVNCT